MTTGHGPDLTIPEIAVSQLKQSQRHLALTVLFHPDVRRIGEVAVLDALDRNESVQLGRLQTGFHMPGQPGTEQPLQDRYLSRTPLVFTSRGKVLEVEIPASGSSVGVGGQAVTDSYRFSRAQLESGAVLLLARRVVLLLHYRRLRGDTVDSCELVGESDLLHNVREMLQRVATTDVPVLLLGESGTGKELVARAIHERSARNEGPLLAVNMAAVPEELAASELFGARRGAYTGADSDRDGYFQRADGGTLFLDEIGDCPASIQTQLLRVLQEGELQSPGGGGGTVDVRCIAATDAELADKEFSTALKHRLGGFEIHLPPLRKRREDIGRLMVHLLPDEILQGIGTDPMVIGQWAILVHDFVLYHWPGNVRELGNYCRQLAIASQDSGQLTVPDNVFAAIHQPAPQHLDREGDTRDGGSQVSDDAVKDAMLEARWEVARAARALQISRQALYKRIEEIPGLRVAADIPVSEIEAAYRECKGELDDAALRLQVSRTALRRRWRSLELNPRDF